MNWFVTHATQNIPDTVSSKDWEIEGAWISVNYQIRNPYNDFYPCVSALAGGIQEFLLSHE